MTSPTFSSDDGAGVWGAGGFWASALAVIPAASIDTNVSFDILRVSFALHSNRTL